jgi:cell division protein FtsW
MLVVAQRDLGTPMIMFGIMFAILWVVGVPGRVFVIGVTGLAVFAAAFTLTERYRIQRITSFLNPFADADGAGYQVVNSLYAISSGGWWGTGIGASGQKWGRLPEAHTDFIFAVVAEELGLFGSLFVLVLFLVLAYGGIRVALAASTTFGRLAVVGVMAWILIQAFINIGGVLSVLPITGVPLPLVSSGGSAMIITLIGLGVVLAVARQEPAARALLGHRRRRRRVA